MWTELYITDKTGAKFFITAATIEYGRNSEVKNIMRHVERCKSNPGMYPMLDAATAKLMETIDGIDYEVFTSLDQISDDELLKELMA